MQNNYEENSKCCENFYKLPESVILEAISYCYKEILNDENKVKFEEKVLKQIAEKDDDLSFILDCVIKRKYKNFGFCKNDK